VDAEQGDTVVETLSLLDFEIDEEAKGRTIDDMRTTERSSVTRTILQGFPRVVFASSRQRRRITASLDPCTTGKSSSVPVKGISLVGLASIPIPYST